MAHKHTVIREGLYTIHVHTRTDQKHTHTNIMIRQSWIQEPWCICVHASCMSFSGTECQYKYFCVFFNINVTYVHANYMPAYRNRGRRRRLEEITQLYQPHCWRQCQLYSERTEKQRVWSGCERIRIVELGHQREQVRNVLKKKKKMNIILKL